MGHTYLKEKGKIIQDKHLFPNSVINSKEYYNSITLQRIPVLLVIEVVLYERPMSVKLLTFSAPD